MPIPNTIPVAVGLPRPYGTGFVLSDGNRLGNPPSFVPLSRSWTTFLISLLPLALSTTDTGIFTVSETLVAMGRGPHGLYYPEAGRAVVTPMIQGGLGSQVHCCCSHKASAPMGAGRPPSLEITPVSLRYYRRSLRQRPKT
jgi:hypothetical protein